MRVHDADLGTGALQCFLLAAIARPALEDGSLFRTPQIHCPISTSRSRSTPVLMPRPCSMYTTSSVATLPEAPAAYGQPPSPATEASNVATPISSAAQRSASAWPSAAG